MKIMNNVIISGLDIGNGYVKGRFLGIDGKPVNIDIPSCAAGLANLPGVRDEANDEFMNDIATEIDKEIIDQTPSADIETGENSFEVKQSGDKEQVQAPVENGNTALL